MQILGGHAGLGNRGQVVGQGGQTSAAAESCQSVQKPVGGAIVYLSRVSEGRGNGGEHYEVVQVIVSGGPVEVQGSVRLGCENLGQRFCGQVGQQTVIQNPGEVEDSLQGSPQLTDTASDVLFPGDVSRDDIDIDRLREVPQGAGFSDPFGVAASLGVAVHQSDMARAGGRQVGKQQPAESTQSAGDQVGSLGIQEGAQVDNREVLRAVARGTVSTNFPVCWPVVIMRSAWA